MKRGDNLNIFSFLGSLLFKKQKPAPAVSSAMQNAIDTWLSLYMNGTAGGETTGTLRLPSSVAAEAARLMLTESEINVSCKYLNEHMQSFWNKFYCNAETALALGGQAFKPYISGDKIAVDIVRADRYVPTAFDSSGNITAAVFMERKKSGDRYYTRLESHSLDSTNNTYTVENKAYCSFSEEYLGKQCSLADVSGWENLTEIQTIANVQKPLFAVFRVPSVSHTDPDSPLGASVYADAAELFLQAERQWERLMWEFEGTELAIDASQDLFRFSGRTPLKRLPRTFRRLFRRHDIQPNVKLSDVIQVFSPAIRDSSIYNGFNRILQRIEFSCGLAYGTLSDPQTVEKTAEEIRTSKQRSFAQTVRIQQSLQNALEHLLYAMEVYAVLYGLPHEQSPKLTCSWGDSVLEDTEKTFQRRLQLAQAGYLKPEYVLEYEFGCSEEEALTMMPNNELTLFGGSRNAVT